MHNDIFITIYVICHFLSYCVICHSNVVYVVLSESVERSYQDIRISPPIIKIHPVSHVHLGKCDFLIDDVDSITCASVQYRRNIFLFIRNISDKLRYRDRFFENHIRKSSIS
ncbi:hypothetical protein AR158_c258L [Paramecium bursaria Chlorella virus AR158]|uniref:hypothetical protein n=1 Tax=Paramecium bursaria Chlorella virus AR158 TaxID=380598 RepID=UPI00015AA8B6|nr:hypothetical protein AR158_c258L [Paramecium bursaria Chlorella virus AR158]ABU43803.1 hypothetical protein AR158_c258L [Paramecium bursaria Chlorella virus AR158]